MRTPLAVAPSPSKGASIVSHLPILEKPSTLEYRLSQEASNLRKQAEHLPLGIRRAELLRKADQMDNAIQINHWVTSPGLRAPM
jgi:hypothetical protein